jgi:hypothetical protein
MCVKNHAVTALACTKVQNSGCAKAIPYRRVEIIDWVEEQLRTQVSHGVIVTKARAKWNLRERAVKSYIAAVYKRWREQSEFHVPEQRNRIRESLQDAYARAKQIYDACSRARDDGTPMDAASAMRAVTAMTIVLERLAKLDGADAPQKIEATITPLAQYGGLTPIEAEERMREIAAAHAHELETHIPVQEAIPVHEMEPGAKHEH